jgi:hypothetical protein
LVQKKLVTYWITTDASQGNVGEIVEDPATSTLYSLTTPSATVIQTIEKSVDFGMTWTTDPTLDLKPFFVTPSAIYADQLQIMHWYSKSLSPLGFLEHSSADLSNTPRFITSKTTDSPGASSWSNIFQVRRSLPYTAGNNQFVFLLNQTTGTRSFGLTVHIMDQSLKSLPIANFEQQPFNHYSLSKADPLSKAYADGNRVTFQASNVTHTLYAQLIDDNDVAHIFSADISNIMTFDPTKAWKDVMAIDLHSKDVLNTQNVVFALYANPTTQSDQLYTGIYYPSATTLLFKIDCASGTKTLLPALTTATAFAVGNDGTLYAGLADGLYSSTDSGATFNVMNLLSSIKFPLQKIIPLEKSRLAVIDNAAAMYIYAKPNANP